MGELPPVEQTAENEMVNALFTIYLHCQWPKMGFQSPQLRGKDGGPLASPADLPESIKAKVKPLDEALDAFEKTAPFNLRRLVAAVLIRGWDRIQLDPERFTSFVNTLPECRPDAGKTRREKSKAKSKKDRGSSLAKELLGLLRPGRGRGDHKHLSPDERFTEAVALLGGTPGSYEMKIIPDLSPPDLSKRLRPRGKPAE